ncbi:probable RNA-binding protein CG14230 [Drosophila subpulchrella]|uniref:probable RNA-binding protein CG14230 n=1 Tax=Drosophila subpulchrella TaxID=1486046 RepID=UPI0018A13382|nr:probable RNA-binding protein CG14230 [Drosophila subpulchrella]
MASTRFFLADLPDRTVEADLHSLFQDYGYVEHVDLKRKEQDGATKVIAFVTLQTDDAQYCVNELKWQKLHGEKLRVSLARESFLDRLKREREENERREQGEPADSEVFTEKSQLLAQSNQNKRRVFGEDEEIGDDEVSADLLITKKRAAHSIQNGRIVIQQEFDAKPLHVIEQHRKPAKQQPDTQVSQAEQKRKESLNKMRQGHQQKKSAIQQALSAISVDGGQAKRIKFSDAEEEEEAKPAQKSKKQKRDLFEGDEDEEEEEQVVLPQHKGKKGERLVEMQSKQSIDPRFRITSNFVDEEEEEGAEIEAPEDQKEPEESERKWQMNILEQVVGHKIDNNDGKPAKSKKMLRFDPAKEDHQKLMRQKQPKEEETPKTKTKDKEVSKNQDVPAPVSKTAFYMVTDTLKDSLNTRGGGFSLLDMFGSAPSEEVAKRQDQLEKLGQEKILVGKASASKLGLAPLNPFSYDSSDSEDEAKPPQEEHEPEVSKENQAQPVKQSKQKKSKIKLESFFIPKNDPRLKEGAKFFKSTKAEVDQADYDQVRNRLKLLISNKIAKTKKNLPSKNIKEYRNKKAKR